MDIGSRFGLRLAERSDHVGMLKQALYIAEFSALGPPLSLEQCVKILYLRLGEPMNHFTRHTDDPPLYVISLFAFVPAKADTESR